MIFIIIYIYLNLYLCIYTPSYPHFKAFPVSKFNLETSFLYQLFKGNSNFIVSKPWKVIYLSVCFWFSLLFIFILLFIYVFIHLDAHVNSVIHRIYDNAARHTLILNIVLISKALWRPKLVIKTFNSIYICICNTFKSTF